VALICDTGPVLAALDRDDPDHRACSSLLINSEEDLIVPGLVLSELDYWCRKLDMHHAWLTFLDDVDSGAWRIVWPTLADLRRARVLEHKYADLALGVVDATIVALAERLNEPKIATLDRRHFAVVRPHHVAALRLLPDF
jgi:predicted nucleic acid-binding protein